MFPYTAKSKDKQLKYIKLFCNEIGMYDIQKFYLKRSCSNISVNELINTVEKSKIWR